MEYDSKSVSPLGYLLLHQRAQSLYKVLQLIILNDLRTLKPVPIQADEMVQVEIYIGVYLMQHLPQSSTTCLHTHIHLEFELLILCVSHHGSLLREEFKLEFICQVLLQPILQRCLVRFVEQIEMVVDGTPVHLLNMVAVQSGVQGVLPDRVMTFTEHLVDGTFDVKWREGSSLDVPLETL